MIHILRKQNKTKKRAEAEGEFLPLLDITFRSIAILCVSGEYLDHDV